MKIAKDIEWDLDTGEEELRCMLPKDVRFNFPIEDDEIADALSNAFFFCVKGFVIEEE